MCSITARVWSCGDHDTVGHNKTATTAVVVSDAVTTRAKPILGPDASNLVLRTLLFRGMEARTSPLAKLECHSDSVRSFQPKFRPNPWSLWRRCTRRSCEGVDGDRKRWPLVATTSQDGTLRDHPCQCLPLQTFDLRPSAGPGAKGLTQMTK